MAVMGRPCRGETVLLSLGLVVERVDRDGPGLAATWGGMSSGVGSRFRYGSRGETSARGRAVSGQDAGAPARGGAEVELQPKEKLCVV